MEKHRILNGGLGLVMANNKRKIDSDISVSKHRRTLICVLHKVTIVKHGEFISFENIKGSADSKLQYLHSIRDKRLAEAHDESLRMTHMRRDGLDSL